MLFDSVELGGCGKKGLYLLMALQKYMIVAMVSNT